MFLGQIHETAPLTLSRDDTIGFAYQWDRQAFHLDDEAAEKSPFGTLVGSGLQSLCAIVKMGIEDGFMSKNCLAGLGIDELRFVSPLYPDQPVFARFEVVETRDSRSSAQRKIVKLRAELVAPENRLILKCMITNLYAVA